MKPKGDRRHARSGGDRPSHCRQGGDQLGQPRLDSGPGSQDGGSCGRGHRWRIRHDRGACSDVAIAERIAGRRPIDQCVALDQHLAVDRRITDHAESRQRLGQHELPEYVGERPLDAAEAADLRSDPGHEPAATLQDSMRPHKRRKPKCERLEQLTRPAWVHRFTDAELRSRLMGAELQLLRLIERDLPNKGIASYLGITEGEVSSRMADLYRTLGLAPSGGPTWLERQTAQTRT